MSLLEENQIEALYDHIGVIRHNEDKSDIDDKRLLPLLGYSAKG